jgi:nitrile hydratase subunit beta
VSGAADARHRFGVGDRVRVAEHAPGGNPRTPGYARGRTGVVAALHGVIDNPLDHRGRYPPLCTVVFTITELTGRQSRDRVAADLHEEWLEPAQPAAPATPTGA